MKARGNLLKKEVKAILPVSFYEQDTVSAAQELLGCFLQHGERPGVSGRDC